MGNRSRRRFAERIHVEQKRLAIIGIAVAAAVGLAGVAVPVVIWLSGSGSSTPPPPIADQWLTLRQHLAQEGWAIRASRREVLRDDGRYSTILVLRPKDPMCARTRSDQVRVFDVANGWLKQTFQFEPSAHGDCQTALVFKVLAVGRFGDDDTPDLIATFSTNDGGPQGIEVPVVITWNPASEHYVLRGLLRSSADIVSFGFSDGPLRGTDKSWFGDAVKLFANPYALSPEVRTWGATSVMFQSHGGAYTPLIVGVYRLNAGNDGPVGKIGEQTPVVYERAIWSLYTNSKGRLLAGNCTIAKRHLLTTQDPGVTLRALMRKAPDLIEGCDTDPSVP